MQSYFLVIGLSFLVFGLILVFRRVRLLSRSSFAEGKLVAYMKNTMGDEGWRESFLPIIEFRAQDGADYRFTSVAGYSHKKYSEGHTFLVRYDKNNPSEAFIDGFLHMWSGPLAMIVMGIASFIIGVKD
jgi:hypothetical protein